MEWGTIKMKLIYSEIKREKFDAPYRKVEAYYPDGEVEPYHMPAMIHLEEGHFHYDAGDEPDNSKWYLCQKPDWRDLPSKESDVIRIAIKVMDGEEYAECAE